MATLEVGSKITCTATHTVTDLDVTTGYVHNTATASSDETGPVDSNQTESLFNLPETGAGTSGTVIWGAVLMGLGAAALLFARRRRIV